MLLASTPSSESLNQFNSSINDGYQKYEVMEEKSNIYYTFKLIRGINNNKMYFGAFLFNEDSKSHKLAMIIDETQYSLPQTSRGDYVIPAMKLEDDVIIRILDELNNERARYTINKITVEEFNNKTTGIINGLNKGLSETKSNLNLNFMTLIVYIFGGIIIVFGGILVYMIIAKKGLFNENKRKSEVFNFREYVEKMTGQNTMDENIVLSDEDINEVRNPQVEEEAQIVNMYPYQREYDDDDEEVDVKKLLQNRGFNTDYQVLNENEKNMIMLELMKMRDLHEITREQYQKEIISLWKN